MFGIFKKTRNSGDGAVERSSRHSRAWGDILAHLKTDGGLRVLDFGATSPANINYLTTLGHSVYMANVVQDAAKPEWRKPLDTEAKPGTEAEFDTDRFVAANLDFSNRNFDVILLWDTANYLPPAMVSALFERLRTVLRPNGRLLAFFHSQAGTGTMFSRYQLTDADDLVVLSSDSFPVQALYQTRQIEKFLQGYSNTRFFLGKDNMREVLAIR